MKHLRKIRSSPQATGVTWNPVFATNLQSFGLGFFFFFFSLQFGDDVWHVAELFKMGILSLRYSVPAKSSWMFLINNQLAEWNILIPIN